MQDPKIKANSAAVEAHFHDEGLNEIEKACEGYTDDIVWEAPARNFRFVNKQDVIDNYRKMFASVKDVSRVGFFRAPMPLRPSLTAR